MKAAAEIHVIAPRHDLVLNKMWLIPKISRRAHAIANVRGCQGTFTDPRDQVG
jgi:hypothetical protein